MNTPIIPLSISLIIVIVLAFIVFTIIHKKSKKDTPLVKSMKENYSKPQSSITPTNDRSNPQTSTTKVAVNSPLKQSSSKFTESPRPSRIQQGSDSPDNSSHMLTTAMLISTLHDSPSIGVSSSNDHQTTDNSNSSNSSSKNDSQSSPSCSSSSSSYSSSSSSSCSSSSCSSSSCSSSSD